MPWLALSWTSCVSCKDSWLCQQMSSVQYKIVVCVFFRVTKGDPRKRFAMPIAGLGKNQTLVHVVEISDVSFGRDRSVRGSMGVGDPLAIDLTLLLQSTRGSLVESMRVWREWELKSRVVPLPLQDDADRLLPVSITTLEADR